MANYDEQILGAKQQAETARKLRESFKMPEGQMVSGWYVRPDAGQGLVEALKLYAGYKGETAAQDKLASILKERETKGNELLAQMPQTRTVPEQVTQQTTQNMQGGMGATAQLLREMGGTNQPPARAMQSQNLTPMDEPQLSDNQKQFAELLRGKRQLPVSNQVIGQQTTGQTVTPAQTIVPTDVEKQQYLMKWQDIDPAKAQLIAKMMEMQAGSEDKRNLLALSMQEKRDAQQRQIEANAQQAKLIASLKPQQDPLVQVEGPDGKPIFMPRSQAAGQTAYTKPNTGTGTPQQRAQDANDAMKILQEAAPLVNKSTSSGIGTLYDSAMGLFGKSTEGADVAAQMKVLGGALVSKMPKMSGPQSDKDVLLYKEMAGKIGDPTVPASQKAMAMKEIMRLQAYYGGTQELPMNFDGKGTQSTSGTIKPAPQGGVIKYDAQGNRVQ